MRKFLNKNTRLFFLSIWIIFTIITILNLFGDTSTEIGSYMFLIDVVGTIILILFYRYNFNDTKKYSKMFFSKVGYCFAGLCVGWIMLSIVSNIFYTPGFFDFTDFGFRLASYPLIIPVEKFTGFEYLSDSILSRIQLYLITFFNLTVIIYFVDILGWIFSKIIKNIIKK